ncbi:MAG: InlB B-repeat-containing protein, partial [Clostridia bacterium]|nr:InlB B-repeat-containing protein [Clostridia bacterium]
MKKLKGMSLLLTLVLLGAVISVIGGTLAYIVAHTDPIVNTFQLGDITYTLTLHQNAGSVEHNDNEVVMPTVTPEGGTNKVAAGSVLFHLDKEPALTGYTFIGWMYKSPDTGILVSPVPGIDDNLNIEVAYNVFPTITKENNVSLELWANWKANEYTVVYDKNADDATGTTDASTHKYDEAKELTPNGFTRMGYTFTGWNTKADGTGTPYADKASVKNLTAESDDEVTLYAQWDAKSYIIRYHANGGTGSMADQTIKYDVPTALSKNTFEKDDHSFMGWALTSGGSAEYIDEQIVTNLLESGTLDLYAVWAQDTHTVTFDYNGGTGSPASKQFLNGKAYGQLPEYPVHPTEVVTGTSKIKTYLFTGWYTSPTGGTRVYPINIANSTEDHTLYAHWEEAPSNNVIQNMIVKNNPDDNDDGVADDLHLEFTCTASFEKYNIPLKNLVPGQKYKLTYTASNDASFGDHLKGYKNSVYGSYILAESALTGGRIEDNYSEDQYVAKVLATWNSRVEADGNNDGSHAAINDTLLQGPWKDQEIVFTATASIMYWVWDFGLMEDGNLDNYNMTDIVLEPVVPEIKFNEKQVIKGTSSVAAITSQTN